MSNQSKVASRRHFIKAAALGGAVVVAGTMTGCLTKARRKAQLSKERAKRVRFCIEEIRDVGKRISEVAK